MSGMLYNWKLLKSLLEALFDLRRSVSNYSFVQKHVNREVEEGMAYQRREGFPTIIIICSYLLVQLSHLVQLLNVLIR